MSSGSVTLSISRASKTNPLGIIARGEVEVDAPPGAEGRGFVQYEFRTTKGLSIAAGLAVALELYVRAVEGVRLPPLVSPGLVLWLAWAFEYTVAWLRVPSLLIRAAGELEPSTEAPGSVTHRDAAT
jgi:hypothetical protein